MKIVRNLTPATYLENISSRSNDAVDVQASDKFKDREFNPSFFSSFPQN